MQDSLFTTDDQGASSLQRMVRAAELPSAPDRELELGAGAELRPYYNAGGITIYHGDCRQIMPLLARCDLLLTDPPYGIACGVDGKRTADRIRSKHGINDDGTSKIPGKARAGRKDYGFAEWDIEPVEEWVMLLARKLGRWQIIFGGNYYTLPPARCWLVWDKENGDNGYADCELAWTNLEKAVRRLKHQWHGMLRKGGEERWHPTQKPLDVMAWALRQAPEDVQTVLDPWMGSGTTLRAAKDHGKQAIGIEREERWCEIAAKRLEQECLWAGAVGIAPIGTTDSGSNVLLSDRDGGHPDAD